MIALNDVKLGPDVVACVRWHGPRGVWSASYAVGTHDDATYRDGHHTGVPGESADACLRNAMMAAELTHELTHELNSPSTQ